MTQSVEEIFVPESLALNNTDSVWHWYRNILLELRELELDDGGRALMHAYYGEAGLLKWWRRPFFRHHYAESLWRAIREIFTITPAPRVLDLGCGTGSQSLLLAMLGASVVAVDLDQRSLEVFGRRVAFYEARLGRRLDIKLIHANAFDICVDELGPFDAIYSLFAFNMMQPSRALLAKLCPSVARSGVIVIQDGNPNHFFNRVFRRRPILSSLEMSREFEKYGFAIMRRVGGYAIPPVAWRLLPSPLLRAVDQWLCRRELLAVSYLHIARKST